MADYRIDFLSAECYPAAKVGGLADVVGALPKYINLEEFHTCNVVMPHYGITWFNNADFKKIHQGSILSKGEKRLGLKPKQYEIRELLKPDLGFTLYAIHLPGLFDRNGIYAENNQFFDDEPERNLAFQRAYLDWISDKSKPDIIHCHDHHVGLIPYMIKHCDIYKKLASIPTVFTIHNGQYHGAFSWDLEYLIPESDDQNKGLLDWNSSINSLSSAIRCAWKVNTVSPQYMIELQEQSTYFRDLYKLEKEKSTGILNGIDHQIWDPKTDTYLDIHLKRSLSVFKNHHKKSLCRRFGLDPKKPLLSFIGRFATEKGVDVIVDYLKTIHFSKGQFLILGTGDSKLEEDFRKLSSTKQKLVHAELKYDEGLAHQIYAGSDFLLMPSRVEPCGLNQMYAMRYGTIPIVHAVGGLENSIRPITDPRPTGIKFKGLTVSNFKKTIDIACDIYDDQSRFKNIQNNAFQEDFSWEASSKNYLKLYYELKKFRD